MDSTRDTERGLNGTFSIAPNADAQSLDLPKKKILKLSYAQMLASVIAIITQFFIVFDGGIVDKGTGIWCGSIFALTAASGIIAVKRNSGYGAKLYLLMSVVSVIFCIPFLILSAYGVAGNNQDYNDGYNRNSATETKRSVNLIGGNRSNEGIIVAFNPVTGIEGPICGEDWDLKDAFVVCRQLGYQFAASFSKEYHLRNVSSKLSYYNVQCNGNEHNLDECSHLNQNKCQSSHLAGIVCSNAETKGTSTVYLSRGQSRNEGNVFAYNPKSGKTGPICDESWDLSDARVVCQQLGYLDATNYTLGSHFGPVPAPFSYDGVQCRGNEENLEQCPHNSYINCNSNKGAGVICTSDIPSPSQIVFLTGGNGNFEGNVFAYNIINKINGPVCDNQWNIKDANVVCRQLGFPKGAIRETKSSYFGTVPEEFSYTFVTCNGDETSLELCYSYDHAADCDGSNGAGAICNTEIPLAVELVGGDRKSGNVYATNPRTGIYGPVCGHSWNMNAAKVVCNQLGFSYVLSLYVNSHFGPVFPPYSYETLSCKGHESSLDFCSDFDSSFCSGQYAGAGVICSEVDINAVYGVHIFLACLVGFLSFVASLTMCKVLCFENVESRQQGMETVEQERSEQTERTFNGMETVEQERSEQTERTFNDQLPPSYEAAIAKNVGKQEERNIYL